MLLELRIVRSTVRLWDYSQDGCVRVLQGHLAPVRGLVWSTELPYMLASGSWDATIRVWDTRDGTCVDAATDHGADVYGKSVSPLTMVHGDDVYGKSPLTMVMMCMVIQFVQCAVITLS